MMRNGLSPRSAALFAAAILGASAGAAYHGDGVSAPSALDALVGARVRARVNTDAAPADAPPHPGGIWTADDAEAPFRVGTAIATDAAGRVFVAGLASPGPRAEHPGLQVTVARLHPDGGYAWSHTCAGSAAMAEPHLAVGPAGDVALAITFQGSLDCGTGRIAAAGGDDDFDAIVVKLDAAGRLAWMKSVSDIGRQALTAVALDPWGSVVIAGSFEGTIDLDGPPLTAESERDVLLARLDADGELVWQRRFGSSGESAGVDVDVAPSGRVLLLATGAAAIDLGGGELAAHRPSAFVASFEPDGHPIWSRRLAGSGEVIAAGLSPVQGDRVVVAGGFTGTADFGAGPLASAGGSDVFVVKLGPGGEALWSRRFGDPRDQSALGVAAGPGGRIALTGRFDGALDFGGGPLVSDGGDIFVAKLSATGQPTWSLRTGGPHLSAGLDVTVDHAGQVLATGALPPGATFTGRLPRVATPADLFAARLGP